MSYRILHLTIKRKWFDLIKSGHKTEEHRELKKYWTKRLKNPDGSWREYDYVYFRNGYSQYSPSMVVEFKGVRVARSSHYENPAYIIDLGEIMFWEEGEPIRVQGEKEEEVD